MKNRRKRRNLRGKQGNESKDKTNEGANKQSHSLVP